MHNSAPVQENNTHKLLWDFDIHSDHLLSARSPDQMIIIIKKITCKIVDFAVLADLRIKLKECEKKDKYHDLVKELKKTTMERAGDNYNSVIGAFGTVTKGLLKGVKDKEVGASGDYPNITLLKTARILRRVLET